MYVCICKQVTDRQIKAAIEQGARTVPQLQAELGVSTCCGECKHCVRNLLRQTNSTATASERINCLPVSNPLAVCNPA